MALALLPVYDHLPIEVNAEITGSSLELGSNTPWLITVPFRSNPLLFEPALPHLHNNRVTLEALVKGSVINGSDFLMLAWLSTKTFPFKTSLKLKCLYED